MRHHIHSEAVEPRTLPCESGARRLFPMSFGALVSRQSSSSCCRRGGGGGFLNNYYDDEGWWALAWIAAYEETNSAQYLNMAEQIFADMTTGWDSSCCGGIWWNKNRTYKNAIANELFLSVAASLAARTSATVQASDLAWAQKEWTWFSASGMINSQNLIKRRTQFLLPE